MAKERRDRQPEKKPDLPPVYDDYDAEDDLESITADLPADKEESASETPEEALKHFRESTGMPEEETEEEKKVRKLPKLFARHLHEAPEEEEEKPAGGHPRLRRFLTLLVTVFVSMVLVSMVLSQLVDLGGLNRVVDAPKNGVSSIMTPVQSGFSFLTDAIFGYFRTWKLRLNIEAEYNNLRAENEQLVYKAMQADEYKYQLSQYENMNDEVTANANMSPIVCTVIGRDDGNYFSTFSINRGSNDGIQPFMAVTYSGALVGYTEDVTSSRSTVRTIIDSEASIAALIQSSRDQGTVRGTLGVDGTAMCRMYYLPDDHLPRPGDTVVTSGVGMSFPKGIPIGTVRESTRGMDANKQYIVVEPTADFQHLEYVIVLRYQPTAAAVEARGTEETSYVPLETKRPYPTLQVGSMNYFSTPTPRPVGGDAAETPEPSESPAPTATPAPTPTLYLAPASGTIAPVSTEEVFEYQVVNDGPTPTPSPSPTPSPTPFETLAPENMTMEDD